MFFLEQFFSEQEAVVFMEDINDPDNIQLKTEIIDPIIEILAEPKNRNAYIEYGEVFLQANSEMLSREFPTKAVSFPRAYVDGLFELFGFEQKQFKEILKDLFKKVNDKAAFNTIVANPTNVIHTIVLIYSDMIQNRLLRDSARQQMGLSIYNNVFNHFFHPPHPVESVMAYVYLQLDNSWGLVKSENIVNWICSTIETCYAYWRSKMDIDMTINILIQFLNRVRSSFQQNIRLLANQYYSNLDKGNMITDDIDSSSVYAESNSTIKIRESLVRRIRSGDQLYKEKNNLYIGTARLKNVKIDSLYEFAQQVQYSDMNDIIDTIFYIFIVKEGNSIDDINTTKYISRITNLPTAVDRAIPGKPVIAPLSKKYKVDGNIVKAYICLLATYIMYRINDVKN